MKQAKKLNHAVVYFIMKDMQPYYTVEKEGFILNTFNPKYFLPSRNHFAEKQIPHLFSEVRDTISFCQ